MSTKPANAGPSALDAMYEQPTSLLTQKFVCALCCDEASSADDSVILTACNHQGCRRCMARWIEKQEASGQANSPTCPFCRSIFHDDEVLAVLGRSFKPQEALSRPDLQVTDELTLQWLNDQTTPCPVCGSRIEKVDGCDHMTCLCGCEFCFECGGVRCLCDDDESAYSAEEEPIRDRDGIVSLRLCIQRANGRCTQEERANRRSEATIEEKERWTCADADDRVGDFHHPTYDGSWLFSCRKSATSAIVLMQQWYASSVRRQRLNQELLNQHSTPVHPSWLFENEDKDSQLRALHVLLCSDSICDVCRGSKEEERKPFLPGRHYNRYQPLA